MDLSSGDILITLGVVELAGCLMCAFYWLRGRGIDLPWIRRQPPTADSQPAPGDSGRHHVPDELLHSATIRLSADGRARARVRHPTDQ